MDIQTAFAEAFAPLQADADNRRWPVAATLGFVVASCAMFWTVAAFGVARLLG